MPALQCVSYSVAITRDAAACVSRVRAQDSSPDGQARRPEDQMTGKSISHGL